jgi:hypothetical protein
MIPEPSMWQYLLVIGEDWTAWDSTRKMQGHIRAMYLLCYKMVDNSFPPDLYPLNFPSNLSRSTTTSNA